MTKKAYRKETVEFEQLTIAPESVDLICDMVGAGHNRETTETGLKIDSQPVSVSDYVLYDQSHHVTVFTEEAFNAIFTAV